MIKDIDIYSFYYVFPFYVFIPLMVMEGSNAYYISILRRKKKVISVSAYYSYYFIVP